MSNNYYDFTPAFVPGTKVRSDAVNFQYQAIENAFNLLPEQTDAITTGTATFAPETGSGNAYVVTMPNTRTSNTDGDEIVFFSAHANTDAATLNVDSIGAVAIVNHEGNVLVANDIRNGIAYVVRYDATNTRFQLISPSASYQTSAATSATAAATSAVTAFAQAVIAGQWATHPEDDDVDSAPGQFSAFHWAQKALAAATTNRVLTDISTATPPTTEAVTGSYQIYDAADDDQLMRLGYIGSNTLRLRNQMHGGDVVLEGENAAGVVQTIMAGDPDAGVSAYFAGNLVLQAQVGGIRVQDDSGNAPRIDMYTDAGVLVSRIQDTGSQLTVQSFVNGNPFVVQADDIGGVVRNILVGDPGAGVSTYFAGQLRSQTISEGLQVQGSADNEVRVDLSNLVGTQRAQFGFIGADELRLDNRIPSGQLSVRGMNAGSVLQRILQGDPDGTTDLYYAGIRRFRAGSAGTVLVHSDDNVETSARHLQFQYQDGTLRGLVGYNGSGILELQNRVHGSAVRISAEDTAGINRTILIGNPDGSTSTYFNGSEVLRTTVTGVALADTVGNDPVLEFFSDGFSTRQGFIQASDTIGLFIRNEVHGTLVTIDGEDAGGAVRNIFVGDPDGVSNFAYHAGSNVGRTLAAANGGMEVNNALTGGGFERVLTTSDGVHHKSVLTADQIFISDTTLADIPGFSFNIAGNGPNFFIRVVLFADHNAALGSNPGMLFQVDQVGGSASGIGQLVEFQTSAVDTQDLSLNVTTIIQLSNASRKKIVYEGRLTRLSGSPVMAIQVAQAASNVLPTTIYAGSFIEVWSE